MDCSWYFFGKTPLGNMQVGCAPVDKSIVQLEFENEVPQSVLNCRARFISTIGAGRENAQGIGSASIHGVGGG